MGTGLLENARKSMSGRTRQLDEELDRQLGVEEPTKEDE